jgi:hypothetical protein
MGVSAHFWKTHSFFSGKGSVSASFRLIFPSAACRTSGIVLAKSVEERCAFFMKTEGPQGIMLARAVLWAFMGLIVLAGSALGASAIGLSRTAPGGGIAARINTNGRIELRDEGLMVLVGFGLIGIGVATRKAA